MSRASHRVGAVRCGLAAILIAAAVLTAEAQFIQEGPKLVGTPASGFAEQGYSVALSRDGSTALMGGAGGGVWVFTRTGGVWTQEGAMLAGNDEIGVSSKVVALSADGNTALFGGDADSSYEGAAWVFTRSNGVWTQQGNKLVAANGIGKAFQGSAVALSANGNVALIGGLYDNLGAGAVWIFRRIGGAWVQGAKLAGSGAVGGASRGYSVSLSADGNTALVGGPFDNGETGAAWVFRFSGGTWAQQGAKLVGAGAVGAARQGISVALSGDGNTAVIGGNVDNGNAGAAWVFRRDSAGVWSQAGGKLLGTGEVSTNGAAGRGLSVATDSTGSTILVGGPGDDASTGAVWVFRRSGAAWDQWGSKLTGTGSGNLSSFGGSVSLSPDGSTAFIGGSFDNNGIGAGWLYLRTPGVILTAPLANDVVAAAGPDTIRWASSGIDSLRVELSLDSGKTFSILIENIGAIDGRYAWLVPDTSSVKCYVRVTDLADTSRYAVSGRFKIKHLRLPVLVLQKGAGYPETPLPNDTVLVGRFTPAHPFDRSSFTPQATNADGILLLDTALYAPGEKFLLLRSASRRPTLKPGHGAVDGLVDEVVLDNIRIDSMGTLRPDTLAGDFDDTTRTYLNHATLLINLVVSIEWPATAEYVDSLVQAFRNASNYLYDVANGQAYLGKVAIYDNGEHWSDCDIRIHASNRIWPCAEVFGIRRTGKHMYLPPRWFGNSAMTRDSIFSEIPLKPNNDRNYRAVIHELGHLALGFYDEYLDAQGDPLSSPVQFGFMKFPYLLPPDPYNSEMSAVVRANFQQSAQWQKNGATCWDFFAQTFNASANGLRIHFQIPAEIGPPQGTDYIPGPNESPALPDVGVGTATSVTSGATGSTAPEFAQRFLDEGGFPFANVDASLVKYPSKRVLRLGGTTDNGEMLALGADIGDTLLANGVVGGIMMHAKVAVTALARRATSSASADIVARPISGSYHMLAEVSFDPGGVLRYSAALDRGFPSPPEMLISGMDQPPVVAPLTADPGGYTALVASSLSQDNSILFTALDSVGAEFSFVQGLSFHAVDSLDREIVDGANGLRFSVDTSSAGIDAIAILGSPFPPPLAGLPDSALLLTQVIALNGAPSTVGLTGRLMLTYGAGSGNAAGIPPGDVAIYHWSNGWSALPTSVDSAHNTAAARIGEAGYYAVYRIQTPTDVNENHDRGSLLPKEFRLEQNFPNPFNPRTTIRYELPAGAHVTLTVVDLVGRTIATLVNRDEQAGYRSVDWDASTASSGMYFYRLEATSASGPGRTFTRVEKMMLIR